MVGWWEALCGGCGKIASWPGTRASLPAPGPRVTAGTWLPLWTSVSFPSQGLGLCTPRPGSPHCWDSSESGQCGSHCPLHPPRSTSRLLQVQAPGTTSFTKLPDFSLAGHLARRIPSPSSALCHRYQGVGLSLHVGGECLSLKGCLSPLCFPKL